MKKAIKIVGLIAAVTTIVNSLLYLIKDIMIPGLGPFSLAIVMLSLIISAKDAYNVGRAKKGYWRFMLYVGGIGFVANIVAGVAQLMNVIK